MSVDINKIKEDSRALKNEAWEKTIGYIIAALSLVAGLAWSDTIKAIIEYLFPINQKGLWLKIVYAVTVTSVVVVISFYLARTINKKSEADKK